LAAQVATAGAKFSGSAPVTYDDASALITLKIELSSAYTNCATSWVGKNETNEGYAEFQAGSQMFTVANI
jgi:hypothetical protein